jgi:peptidoglycan L-alanyl-D-glutamate endopeptidase CwlK
MNEYAIPGTADLAQIGDFIANIEVAGARFVGARIDGERTIAAFVIELGVPPRPQVLAADAAPPADSLLAWAGPMRVGGETRQVHLWRRRLSAELPPGGLEAKVAAVQEKLGVGIDGRAGPETWGALAATVLGPGAANIDTGTADARSERHIASLQPEVRPYARALWFKARAHGIDIKVISGTRSFREQDRLYAQGRTTAGPKVTSARAGESVHNYGHAFDIGVFEGREYLGSGRKYDQVGVLGQEIGLHWGGTWRKPDRPHFELWPAWFTGGSSSEFARALRERMPEGYGG